MKPALLLAHINMADPGGGTAVFAWALAALAPDFQITVVTLRPASLEQLDARFGTSLSGTPVRIVTPSPVLSNWFFGSSARVERLKVLALSQLAKRTRRSLGDPPALSTSNELDLGKNGVQYVHFPFTGYRADLTHLRGLGLLAARAYLTVTDPLIARHARLAMQNLTLCNSSFTRAHYERETGQRAEILYPPARAMAARGACVPFETRPLRVVGVGRISPEKRWLEAIEVVERVRALGAPLELQILGAASDARYLERVVRVVRERPWVSLGIGLSRTELENRVCDARFGLHMAIEEHFGISVVELLSAGCVTFVHDSAGPAEIVGDPDCRFRSCEEAADLLVHASRNPEHALRLHRAALERAEVFSEQRFMRELRSWFSNERAADALSQTSRSAQTQSADQAH